MLRNERKLEIASNIDAIMEGKKAKKRNTAKFEENSEPPKREDVLQEEFKKIEFSNESALTVQLCTSMSKSLNFY